MNHSIRLRDPWSLLPTTSTEAAPARPTMELSFSRKFNAPTGLAPLQSVLLELKTTPLVSHLAVQLNGQLLHLTLNPPAAELQAAPLGLLHFELREHLQAFNVLLVTIESQSEAAPLVPLFHTFCEARLLL